MSLRQNLLVTISIAVVVLGLSTTSIFAHETDQRAQRDQPSVTSQILDDFTITDAFIKGDRIILHGLRSNRKTSVSLTIQNPGSQPIEEAKETQERFFERVFNRDSAS